MLDVPELEPLDGVVVVAEVGRSRFDADADDDGQTARRRSRSPAATGSSGRLNERALPGPDD